MAKFDEGFYEDHIFQGYGTSPKRKARRQVEADDRKMARDARGDAGQLARLEARGHGHCKEATRLREKLEMAKESN